jgi:hypothetical protein
MDASMLAKMFASGAIAAALLAAVLGMLALRFASRADDAGTAVAQARQEMQQTIAAAETRAREASERAVRAETRAASLEADVRGERERADAAEEGLRGLRVRMGPRSLNRIQLATLVDELKPFAGQHVEVMEVLDAEVTPFADQLHQAFTDAGWTVSRSRLGVMIPHRYGVVCEHADGDRAAAALVQRLKYEHIAVSEAPGRSLAVVVGLRPPA